jgi:hypothetical protein
MPIFAFAAIIPFLQPVPRAAACRLDHARDRLRIAQAISGAPPSRRTSRGRPDPRCIHNRALHGIDMGRRHLACARAPDGAAIASRISKL